MNLRTIFAAAALTALFAAAPAVSHARDYGDWDEHHVWRDRGWWYDHHPEWIHKHHPDWARWRD